MAQARITERKRLEIKSELDQIKFLTEHIPSPINANNFK